MEKESFLQLLNEVNEVTLIGPLDLKCDYSNISPIIFVDGGLGHKREGTAPSITVGDNDSNSLDQAFDYLLKEEKDYSDLAFALSLIPENVEVVNMVGFTGKRLDHQMANFGEIHHFLSSRKTKTIVLIDQNAIFHSKGEFIIEHFTVFSILSLETQEISISGKAKYLLNEAQIKPLSSLGLSNVGSGEIKIKCQGPILVFLNE